MNPVTVLNNGPDFRFATSVKAGSVLTVTFVIEGYASIVNNSWRAQLRGKAGRLIGVFGVATTLYTVTTSNDSCKVTMTIPGVNTALFQPGVYMADCEDITLMRTWASGTVEILRDWSH